MRGSIFRMDEFLCVGFIDNDKGILEFLGNIELYFQERGELVIRISTHLAGHRFTIQSYRDIVNFASKLAALSMECNDFKTN
jgi:hypothetical protein